MMLAAAMMLKVILSGISSVRLGNTDESCWYRRLQALSRTVPARRQPKSTVVVAAVPAVLIPLNREPSA